MDVTGGHSRGFSVYVVLECLCAAVLEAGMNHRLLLLLLCFESGRPSSRDAPHGRCRSPTAAHCKHLSSSCGVRTAARWQRHKPWRWRSFAPIQPRLGGCTKGRTPPSCRQLQEASPRTSGDGVEVISSYSSLSRRRLACEAASIVGLTIRIDVSITRSS